MRIFLKQDLQSGSTIKNHHLFKTSVANEIRNRTRGDSNAPGAGGGRGVISGGNGISSQGLDGRGISMEQFVITLESKAEGDIGIDRRVMIFHNVVLKRCYDL